MLTLALLAATTSSGGSIVSFEDDIQPILKQHCVMCHLPGAALGGLQLYPDAWRSMVGVTSAQSPLELVKAGDPDKSYLYLKLIGTHETAGGSGELMPIQQPPLDSAQIDLIRTWIEQGAKDN
jgi:mono/diheme cytochrome c family protein